MCYFSKESKVGIIRTFCFERYQVTVKFLKKVNMKNAYRQAINMKKTSYISIIIIVTCYYFIDLVVISRLSRVTEEYFRPLLL